MLSSISPPYFPTALSPILYPLSSWSQKAWYKLNLSGLKPPRKPPGATPWHLGPMGCPRLSPSSSLTGLSPCQEWLSELPPWCPSLQPLGPRSATLGWGLLELGLWPGSWGPCRDGDALSAGAVQVLCLHCQVLEFLHWCFTEAESRGSSAPNW
jgi:hypothetical protein